MAELVIWGVSEDDEEIYIRLFVGSPPRHGAEESHVIDSELFGDPLLRCLFSIYPSQT